jgi:parallel beta-helix repeat protein
VENVKGIVCFLSAFAVLSAIVLLCFLPTIQAKVNVSVTVNPGDSIQQAINNASDGGNITISSGTYYESRIIVNKTLTLLGSDAQTTVIDDDGTTLPIFDVRADGVKIRNLTLQNTGDSGGIGVDITNFTNVEISDCIIKQCYEGISLTNSYSCTVARNIIKDNYFNGIYLHANSSDNYILGNTIQNNTDGVNVESSIDKHNMFRSNNFLYNTFHTQGFGRTANYWNGTYPCNGNFWSDYSGVDLCHGPYQNISGSDGIGDTNHTIVSDAADFYPLMTPVHYFYSGIWFQQEYYVAIGATSNVSDFNFYTDETEPFINFTLTDSNTNSCRVAIPEQMLFVSPPANWTVEVNQTTLSNVLILEDTDTTYFYLNFTQASSVTIKTAGTGAIPEFPKPVMPTLLFVITISVFLDKRKKKSYSARCEET